MDMVTMSFFIYFLDLFILLAVSIILNICSCYSFLNTF